MKNGAVCNNVNFIEVVFLSFVHFTDRCGVEMRLLPKTIWWIREKLAVSNVINSLYDHAYMYVLAYVTDPVLSSTKNFI